jgi:PadR family transcriptional regulator, regulatory protein AphA
MNYQLVEHAQNNYIACLVDGGKIENENDALDLVGICGEHQAHRLLLHGENLTDDFYNLRTGLAGAVLQKFVNYYIKTAIILPLERANQGRFGEMVLEANRSNRGFHVFQEEDKAVEWLVRE